MSYSYETDETDDDGVKDALAAGVGKVPEGDHRETADGQSRAVATLAKALAKDAGWPRYRLAVSGQSRDGYRMVTLQVHGVPDAAGNLPDEGDDEGKATS